MKKRMSKARVSVQQEEIKHVNEWRSTCISAARTAGVVANEDRFVQSASSPAAYPDKLTIYPPTGRCKGCQRLRLPVNYSETAVRAPRETINGREGMFAQSLARGVGAVVTALNTLVRIHRTIA